MEEFLNILFGVVAALILVFIVYVIDRNDDGNYGSFC